MTIVMQTVSKAQFKSHLLEYLRKVEKDKKPLVVTHAGKPVVEVKPYKEKAENVLKSLRGTLIYYKDPNEPVGLEDWEALK
ncbi:type II toxin-antitoxin system Phd/YefM family antitoxin [Candidatus Curtissbacteria bacterium]|nr:type II toxin-antitoxin system Phd/YefM family antitoxin [Candidatus Curtissbacteria bacterium]